MGACISAPLSFHHSMHIRTARQALRRTASQMSRCDLKEVAPSPNAQDACQHAMDCTEGVGLSPGASCRPHADVNRTVYLDVPCMAAGNVMQAEYTRKLPGVSAAHLLAAGMLQRLELPAPVLMRGQAHLQ